MIAAILHLQESPRAIFKTFDQMAGGFFHRHNVIDQHFFICIHAPRLGLEFQIIADNLINLLHLCIALWINLGCTARNNNARPRVIAPRTADCLTRLALGLLGDRAGIEDDRVLKPCIFRMRPHHFGLIGVKPAAKSDKLWVVFIHGRLFTEKSAHRQIHTLQGRS